ncbi:MAG: hypothetical protein MZW92_12650 [Comamonadaceae bacterium]|nr:hypothetical protein [Comamonadaceae bacterium]
MDRYLHGHARARSSTSPRPLTKLEGLERGPAGNTRHDRRRHASPARWTRDQIVVVQETEYTGAGKHH